MKQLLTIAALILAGLTACAQYDQPSISFSTMADMQARIGSGHVQATLKSYYIEGDGGGGDFRWVDTSTATPIAGIIVQSAGVTPGRWIRIVNGSDYQLKWFGVKADGVTEEHAAMQVANDYCEQNNYTLHFPGSNCIVNLPIYRRKNSHWVGEKGKSTITNTRVSATLLGDQYCFMAGNFSSGDYNRTLHYPVFDTVHSNTRNIKLLPAYIDSISVGNLIFLESTAGNSTGAGGLFRPRYFQVCKVDSIDRADSLIIIQNSISEDIFPAKVGICTKFTDGLAHVDQLSTPLYIAENITTENMSFVSNDYVTRRMGFYKWLMTGCEFTGTKGIGGNAMAYGVWYNNIFHWSFKAIESAWGSHDNVIDHCQFLWFDNGRIDTDNVRASLKLGENTRNLKVSFCTIDGGNGNNSGIRIDNGRNISINNTTLYFQNIKQSIFDLSPANDSCIIQENFFTNNIIYTGIGQFDIDMRVTTAHNIVKGNSFDGNKFYGSLTTRKAVWYGGDSNLTRNNVFQPNTSANSDSTTTNNYSLNDLFNPEPFGLIGVLLSVTDRAATIIGDSDYTMLKTDNIIQLATSLTASRTITLINANMVTAGTRIVIQDFTGSVDTTNYINIAHSSTNTINGLGNTKIQAAYGGIVLYSDGVSQWNFNSIVGIGSGGSGSSGITALTGDVTASGTGSVAATLATVNSNVGSFGDATHVGAFTVNGKGLVTAASSVAITGFSPTFTVTAPITYSSNVIGITQATTSTNGYLSSTDWNTFNGKQAALSGTGFVKFSGTTPSYIPQIGLTTDVTGILPVSNGGTGTSSPGIVAGLNITVTGTWPNQTVNATGGGGSSQPFADNTALIKNNSDNTKTALFYAGNITTGTLRSDTIPNTNGTLLLRQDTTGSMPISLYTNALKRWSVTSNGDVEAGLDNSYGIGYNTSSPTALNGANGVWISGNYAYIAAYSSNALEIIDISTPANPVHVGKLLNGSGGALLNGPIGVQVVGNYAYITSNISNALEIVDVSNPAAPTHAASLIDGAGGANVNHPWNLDIVGNYCFISTTNALEIVDISTPTSPVHAGKILDGAGGANLNIAVGVKVSGNYAFVTAFNGNALEIVDITTKTAPVHAGKITDGTGGAILTQAHGIWVVGNYAYVTSRAGNALEVVDVTTKTAPVHAAKLLNGSGGAYLVGAENLQIVGSYAYIADYSGSGFDIVDISTPTSPTHVGTLLNGVGGAALNLANRVYVSGSKAYIASFASNGLEVIDVTTPATPTHLSSLLTGTANRPKVVNVATSIEVPTLTATSTFSSPIITSQSLVGGSANVSSITYKTTTGVGVTGADHIFQVGNNGATEAMRILNNGNVGIGVVAPTYKVEDSTSGTDVARFVSSNSSRGTLLVQTTNSASQSNIYLTNNRGLALSYGGLVFGGSTNSAGNLFGLSRPDRLFVVGGDGTNNAGMGVGTLNNTSLVLGTNNSAVETITGAGVTSFAGNVGIGTTPGMSLDVLAASGNPVVHIKSATGNTQLQIDAASGKNSYIVYQNAGANIWYIGNVQFSGTSNRYAWTNSDANGNTEVASLFQTGVLALNTYGAGSVTIDGSHNVVSSSDSRLKHNIQSFRLGLPEIMKLHPATFIYNKDSSNLVMPGFIAQDVKKAGLGIGVNKDKDGYYSLNTNAILAAAVIAIQTQQAEIEALKKEVNHLKKDK